MSTSVDNEEEITIEDDGDESEGEEGGTDVAADREGVGEVESSEEEEGAEFPDTSVTIAHVGGDMFVYLLFSFFRYEEWDYEDCILGTSSSVEPVPVLPRQKRNN